MANSKSGGPKKGSDRLDAMIGRIGLVSHHLGSLLGVIVNHVYPHVCRVGYLDSSIRETVLYK